MQFQDFFIIKEGGICTFSFNDDSTTSGAFCHDLITPFFMAINSFTNENYKEKIRWIELDDGTSIYFKHFTFPGDIKVTVAGVFPEHVNGKKNTIERCVIELKWLLNKHVKELTSSISISPSTRNEIKGKIRLMFA